MPSGFLLSHRTGRSIQDQYSLGRSLQHCSKCQGLLFETRASCGVGAVYRNRSSHDYYDFHTVKTKQNYIYICMKPARGPQTMLYINLGRLSSVDESWSPLGHKGKRVKNIHFWKSRMSKGSLGHFRPLWGRGPKINILKSQAERG